MIILLGAIIGFALNTLSEEYAKSSGCIAGYTQFGPICLHRGSQ